jgi:hypothetical protein
MADLARNTLLDIAKMIPGSMSMASTAIPQPRDRPKKGPLIAEDNASGSRRKASATLTLKGNDFLHVWHAIWVPVLLTTGMNQTHTVCVTSRRLPIRWPLHLGQMKLTIVVSIASQHSEVFRYAVLQNLSSNIYTIKFLCVHHQSNGKSWMESINSIG